MPTSLAYMRGDAKIDPERRRYHPHFVNRDMRKVYAVRCERCKLWKLIVTSNLPKYVFTCDTGSCPKSIKGVTMRGTKGYKMDFKFFVDTILAQNYINYKNKEVRCKDMIGGI